MRLPTRLMPLFAAAMAFSGLLTAGAEPGAAAEICATVTFLRGTPVLTGEEAPFPLTEGQRLYAGSTVQTDDSARIEMVLPGGGIVRLSEGSVLAMGGSAAGPARSESRRQLVLLAGDLWADFSNQGSGDSPRILALGALIEGPESIFRTALYREGGLEVKAYTGQVTVSGPFVFKRADNRYSLETNQGDEENPQEPWRHQITPYKKVMVLDSGAASQPFRFAAKSDLTDWVRWNQQRDEEEGPTDEGRSLRYDEGRNAPLFFGSRPSS